MAETTRTRGRPGVGNNSDVRTDLRTNMQKAAMVVGLMFLLVGILGFVPGITSHLSDMKFASESSHAKLLGIFEVSVLHNIVHLLFGLAGIAAAKRYASSRTYLIAVGVCTSCSGSTAW